MCKTIELAIKSGAKTINIPDTVGYTLPEEFGKIFREVRNNVTNIMPIFNEVASIMLKTCLFYWKIKISSRKRFVSKCKMPPFVFIRSKTVFYHHFS